MGEDGFARLRAANRRRSVAILMALFVPALLVVGLVQLLLGPLAWAAAVVVLVVVFVPVLQRVRTSRALLRLLGAVAADAGEHARLHNVVEGLCAAAGLPKPGLYVVRDDAPNALAAGWDTKSAALVVTTGLLEKLDRMELEGVVAHELSHIKSGDIQVSTLTANLFGRFAPGLAARLAPPRRELLADVNSVSLTRYPPGLAAALEKLRVDPAARPTAGGQAVAHMWIETPEPPLEERIAALLEL